MRSEQFYTLWVQMNRFGHKAFIAAISDKSTGVIQKQGGTITLETTVLVDQIKQALSSRGLGFVNNINIPIKNQQIVLVDSAGLEQLGGVIQVMNTMAFLLPFLALAMLARRRCARHRPAQGGACGSASASPPRCCCHWRRSTSRRRRSWPRSTSLAGCPNPQRFAAYTIVFRNLVAAQQLFTVVGLVFVVGAILAGPNRFATSLRNGFKHGMASIGPDWDFGACRRVDLRAPERHAHRRHHRRDRDAADRPGRGRMRPSCGSSVFVVAVDGARGAVRPPAAREGRRSEDADSAEPAAE